MPTVEELVVKISADVTALRTGLDQAGAHTKKFEKEAGNLKKQLNDFRGATLASIGSVGSFSSAMDALSGRTELTAGSIGGLVALLPAMTNPIGMASVGFGLMAGMMMRVVEQERQIRENRTAELLKQIEAATKIAAAGWDGYFKALVDGQTRSQALTARAAAEQSSALDQRKNELLAKIADAKKAIDADVQARASVEKTIAQLDREEERWKKLSGSHLLAAGSLKRIATARAEADAKLGNMDANVASVKEWEKALREITETNARVTKGEKDRNEALKEEAELLKELIRLENERAEADRKAFADKETKQGDAKAKRELDELFRTSTVGANEHEIALKRNEQALADLRAEIMFAQETGGPFPEDFIFRAQSLKMEIEANRAALTAWNAEQAIHRKEVDETKQMYEQLAQTVGNAFGDILTGTATVEEAMQAMMRDIIRQLIQMAIARVMANAAVFGSEVAVQNSWAGPAAIGIGVAAAAALGAALTGSIPAFNEGGIVGGNPGRDKNIVRVSRGEEILRSDDPRHRNNFGGGGINVTIEDRGLVQRSPAEMDRLVRQSLKRTLENMARRGELKI